MIKRVSTAEAVVNHFSELIQKGQLGPGDKLPSERILQEELGISRFSLREGLAKLEALGIIEIRHGKGARVREVPTSEALSSVLLPLMSGSNSLKDLAEARMLVEGELAAMAASKASDEDVALLEGLLSAPITDDDNAVADLDYRFHKETARIADNAFMTVMFEALSHYVHSFLKEYVSTHKNHQEVVDRHQPLLDAIKSADPDIARAAARKHIKICTKTVRKKPFKED